MIGGKGNEEWEKRINKEQRIAKTGKGGTRTNAEQIGSVSDKCT